MSNEASNAIRRFITAHGGSAQAVLQPVGRCGVRITLVGADGILGDRMVDTMERARSLVESTEGLTTADWDRELMALATPRASNARRMAGRIGRSA